MQDPQPNPHLPPQLLDVGGGFAMMEVNPDLIAVCLQNWDHEVELHRLSKEVCRSVAESSEGQPHRTMAALMTMLSFTFSQEEILALLAYILTQEDLDREPT